MKIIKCPHCNSYQVFEMAEDGIYFPSSPYCCEIMASADSPHWNKLLDNALASVVRQRIQPLWV